MLDLGLAPGASNQPRVPEWIRRILNGLSVYFIIVIYVLIFQIFFLISIIIFKNKKRPLFLLFYCIGVCIINERFRVKLIQTLKSWSVSIERCWWCFSSSKCRFELFTVWSIIFSRGSLFIRW